MPIRKIGGKATQARSEFFIKSADRTIQKVTVREIRGSDKLSPSWDDRFERNIKRRYEEQNGSECKVYRSRSEANKQIKKEEKKLIDRIIKTIADGKMKDSKGRELLLEDFLDIEFEKIYPNKTKKGILHKFKTLVKFLFKGKISNIEISKERIAQKNAFKYRISNKVLQHENNALKKQIKNLNQ